MYADVSELNQSNLFFYKSKSDFFISYSIQTATKSKASNKDQSDATTNNLLSPHQHKISLAA
jgi:hypothetical protein